MSHLLTVKSALDSQAWPTRRRGAWRTTASVLSLVLAWGGLPAICQGQAVAPLVQEQRDSIAHDDHGSLGKDREGKTDSDTGYNPADACAQLRRQCIYAGEERSGLMDIMCRPPLAGVRDDEGRTPLMMAVKRRDLELTAFLLEITENVNAMDYSGDTAIIHAAVMKSSGPNGTEIIKMLLEHGAEMSLFVTAALGDEQKARRLILAGADVNARTGEGFTPLLIALQSRHPRMARLLLDNGADVNVENSNGSTPLWEACRKWDETMKRLLMARGAKMTLSLAAGVCDWLEVRRLIDSGADVNMKGWEGDTPLYWAIRDRSVEQAKFLIEKGADVNARDRDGSTPLIEAAVRGTLDLVTLLTERGADVNARTKKGLTPLGAVAYRASVDEAELLQIAEYLMNEGADTNFHPHDAGLTPLMHAAQRKRPKLVKLLIERGAAVNARSRCPKTMHLLPVLDCPFGPGPVTHDKPKQGRTSGGSFWTSHRTQVRRWLITAGSSISKTFDDGVTPLMLAVDTYDLESVRVLIAAGADVNAKTTSNRKTALHGAVGYEFMKTLIQHGADVNAQTSVGGTPLMCAASTGEVDRCKLLVDHGANVNIRSRDGYTALDLAFGPYESNDEVVEYLKSKGAISGLTNLRERDE
jgi:ankyrin repeat protein